MDPVWVLTLPENVTVAADADDEFTLHSPHSTLRLRDLAPGHRAALRRLTAPGESAGRLADYVREVAGPAALALWYYHLQSLAQRRLLRLEVHAGSTRLATLEPTASSFILPPAGAQRGRPYVLSRFAWLQRRGDVLALESPLSAARIVLHDQRAVALIHVLARPGTAAEIAGRVPDLPSDVVTPLLGLLAHAGAASAIGEDGASAEDTDPALRCWQFHDLLFHARSREGRHDAAVGATYPLAGQIEPVAALQQETAEEGIALFRPELDMLQIQDPPFAFVQERRRSVRNYAAEPITQRQLGEFLYRVARVRDCHRMEVATPAGPVQMDFALRPYPAGGGPVRTRGVRRRGRLSRLIVRALSLRWARPPARASRPADHCSRTAPGRRRPVRRSQVDAHAGLVSAGSPAAPSRVEIQQSSLRFGLKKRGSAHSDDVPGRHSHGPGPLCCWPRRFRSVRTGHWCGLLRRDISRRIPPRKCTL